VTVWLLIDPIPLLHKGWNGVGLVRHPPPFHSCGRNGIGGGETNLWLRFPRAVWAISGHASHLALNLGCGRLSMLLSNVYLTRRPLPQAPKRARLRLHAFAITPR